MSGVLIGKSPLKGLRAWIEVLARFNGVTSVSPEINLRAGDADHEPAPRFAILNHSLAISFIHERVATAAKDFKSSSRTSSVNFVGLSFAVAAIVTALNSALALCN